MTRLVLIFALLISCSLLQAQIFVYGLAKNGKQSTTVEKATYNAIEEALMAGLFEAGLVNFNVRDEQEFHLESALFIASGTGSQFVFIWQVDYPNFTLMLYDLNGTKYAEQIVKMPLGVTQQKEITDSYTAAVQKALPQFLNIIRRN